MNSDAIIWIAFVIAAGIFRFYILEKWYDQFEKCFDWIYEKLFEKPIKKIEYHIDLFRKMSIVEFDRIWKEHGKMDVEIDFDITTSSKKQDFINFLREHKDEINWQYISHYCTFDDKILNEFKDYLDLKSLQIYKTKMPESFIRRWKEDFSMQNLLMNQNLSEDFLREYADQFKRLEWNLICRWQKLSESFIREFTKKVNWKIIVINQDISLDFVKENHKKVKWLDVSQERLTEEQIDKYKDYLEWVYVLDFNHMRMSDEFIEAHEKYIVWESLRPHFFHDGGKMKKKYKHLIWGGPVEQKENIV